MIGIFILYVNPNRPDAGPPVVLKYEHFEEGLTNHQAAAEAAQLLKTEAPASSSYAEYKTEPEEEREREEEKEVCHVKTEQPTEEPLAMPPVKTEPELSVTDCLPDAAATGCSPPPPPVSFGESAAVVYGDVKTAPEEEGECTVMNIKAEQLATPGEHFIDSKIKNKQNKSGN